MCITPESLPMYPLDRATNARETPIGGAAPARFADRCETPGPERIRSMDSNSLEFPRNNSWSASMFVVENNLRQLASPQSFFEGRASSHASDPIPSGSNPSRESSSFGRYQIRWNRINAGAFRGISLPATADANQPVFSSSGIAVGTSTRISNRRDNSPDRTWSCKARRVQGLEPGHRCAPIPDSIQTGQKNLPKIARNIQVRRVFFYGRCSRTNGLRWTRVLG